VAATALATERERVDGRYLVLGTLGLGGMGTVYRVLDEATGKHCALKQMTAPREGEALGARLRFRREFHTMASLRHPRIVEVFDYGIADARPYYTLELLDGEDLHDLDRVPAGRACELLSDVASALAFLHARRLLHRDLATRNVRCTADGRAKLIDFGVLATAGVAGDVAGTPPYIAPETLRGRPLDHRVDLFGLGALAYRILTGKQAFPARTVDQLEPLWRERPLAPSSLAPDISPALDELVLSLLAIEPLARPAGAAEVIGRLSAISGVSRAPEVGAAHGWIASAALVGRQREVSQIRRTVAKVQSGEARSVLIEAPSGTGKTRMLRELALEAQIAGLLVARVGSSDLADRGPYGIVHGLARSLLASCPDEALAAARPRGAMLARVIEELRARLGVAPAQPAGDPAEDRMRLQAELAAWFLAVAERRPIALVVDDVQRCDEASAAVLAALAHGDGAPRLLVAAALRTDEPVRAPAAIASLCDAGRRMRLRGLDEPELGQLCRSLFGDVPHIARLANWMHRTAGGSPLHSIELARHLVERGTIRYADGMWIVPEELGHTDLPRGLPDALDARIRTLPAEARALGELLAVHGGELALPRIVALADADEDDVFAALDQLAFEEVVIHADERWRFRHDGLREALLRGLGDERRRELHRRVGDVLAAGADSDDAATGWHLLRGGDARRGAALLERAGRALYDAQSFSDCIAPLEAALAADVRRTPRDRLRLQHLVLMAGCMADRKAALRHVDACVGGYQRWAGVGVATAASRVVGRHLGVAIGLLWATLRWLAYAGRGPNPFDAFRTFFIVAGYASTIHSLSFDLPGARANVELVEPVAILPHRVPYAVYLLIQCLHLFPLGVLVRARDNALRILDILDRDRITPIREIDRRTGAGGAHYMIALVSVFNQEPDAGARLTTLDQLGLRFFEIGADQARIIGHRLRGEESLAETLESAVELRFVQLGSMWQIQAFVPIYSALAYGYTRDMLGLRRCIEQLAGMCEDGFGFAGFLALTRGEYLRERGDVAAAAEELAPLVEHTDFPMLSQHALPAYAETLLALGDPARAKAIAEQGVTHNSEPEQYNLHAKVRSLRVLALAEAALGDGAAAAARLDRAIADTAAHASPLISGSLHETRARIAAAAHDSLAYHQHLAETQRWFRATRNPVLIARAARLEAFGEAIGARRDNDNASESDDAATEVASPRRHIQLHHALGAEAVTTPVPVDPRAHVSAVLSACRGANERAIRSLELVVAEARGAHGYLYLKHAGQLTLVAPTFGDEPSTVVRHELARSLARHEHPGAESDDESTAQDHPTRRYLAVPLVFQIGDKRVAVGAVAVFAGALPLVAPDPAIVAEVARELFDAGDAQPTVLSRH
jgi:protein kinase-like protein/AAA ATPase-like protein